MKNAVNDVTFRNVTEEDAPALLSIYRYYVENTAITFEWETPSEAEFRERIRKIEEKYPYLAAVQDGRIIGYAYANTFKDRAAYDWSVETTIYLDQNVRHRGVGKRLYRALEEALKPMHILNLNACIGYPKTEDAYLTKNSAEFHAHLGYRMVGRFHDSGYKFGRWYDMVWMEKMIGEHGERPEKVISYKKLGKCAKYT